MNSITLKKGILNLSLCLITAFTLTSCASTNSRSIAEEHKDDVSKIEDGRSPHEFHGKRFQRNDNY